MACTVGSILFCGHTAFGQESSVGKVIRFLASSKPIEASEFEPHLLDSGKRTAAEQLFSAQMKALSELKGCKDPSVVTTLIPYLDYRTDANPPYEGHEEPPGYVPGLDTLTNHQPAFAILLNIPGSDKVLADYTKNTANPIRLRIATFHVLRYVNLAEFKALSHVLDPEFAKAGPQTKAFIEAIENGSLPFEGLCLSKFDE